MLALYGPAFTTAPFTIKRAPLAPVQTVVRPPSGGLVLTTSSPPGAPTVPPVIITTAPPPDQPLSPPTTVPGTAPGAGPVATMQPGTEGNWYDLFDPNSFAWWKPVLLAVGLAAFGGAIIAGVRAATKSR